MSLDGGRDAGLGVVRVSDVLDDPLAVHAGSDTGDVQRLLRRDAWITFRERKAEAEARATETISNALAQGNIQVINYFVAEKYMEVLKELAASPNQKTILMPLEASNVIGSLAGITEIAAEAFKAQPIPVKKI